MRNKIMKLAERNRLNFSHLPLPPQEEMALRRLFPEALEKLLSPDVFEFTWKTPASGSTPMNELTIPTSRRMKSSTRPSFRFRMKRS